MNYKEAMVYMKNGKIVKSKHDEKRFKLSIHPHVPNGTAIHCEIKNGVWVYYKAEFDDNEKHYVFIEDEK